MAEHETNTVLLTGASGVTYEFEVFHPDARVPAAGGVFVVSSRDRAASDDRQVWLVGRAANLSRTLDQVKRHARLTHGERRWRYCVRIERYDSARRSAIARDLAAAYRLRRQPDGNA